MGCNGLVLRREKPEPPMSQLGHFRQIDPLPTFSACPLRSDRARTFAPQRIDAVCQELTHAAQQTSRHSMISSAVARSVCGIVRPSAFAVFILMTISSLVGHSTGRAPGLAPFKILSTNMAARR